MKATLADAALMRDAGRFVWLELDFDKPANQAFLARHGVRYTPTLLVLDPATERATATNYGGLSVADLRQFLDRGGQSLPSLARALVIRKEYRKAAEMAEAEAPKLPRDSAFASVVLSGLMSANVGGAEPWAVAARRKLEPLAAEGTAMPSALRDERFQLHQQLMYAADLRGDKAAVTRWGERWLAFIDATKPVNDDERSALDIARVDAASEMDQPARVIPALMASERAMPANYNASLRLAQMLVAAKRYDETLAACDRGLAHVSGPIGRSWLLRTKAEAFIGKGDRAAAHRALSEALQAAQKIGTKDSRENNVRRISEEIKAIDKP
jgi:tetratricopeptide (TPR) repeat protein